MKVIILAGGLGTRLSEETYNKPKPMVEIGGKPILWHIMKIYASYGFKEFIIALGYRGELIKDFFLRFYSVSNDFTIHLSTGKLINHNTEQEEWVVHLIDTGKDTQTGGRIKRLSKWIGSETCLCTYGDGLADINLGKLLDFHKSHGKLATITGVRPPSRFGELDIRKNQVVAFSEKPQAGTGWINGGFFVLEPEILHYIEGDRTIWEKEPLERLARDNQLYVFPHHGFWQPMDTLREQRSLQKMWDTGNPPWKIWDKDQKEQKIKNEILAR